MSDLASAYAHALRTWLARRDEASLTEGSAIGRNALGSGAGLLDLVRAHHAALRTVLPDDAEALDSAEDFFREALAPFESALRGCADANARVRELDAALLREREAAMVATRELESFSHSVSHDLRAPLRAIDGFSRILEEDAGERLTAEDLQNLSRVRRGAEHMTQLIDGLLALSRVARAEMETAQVDLAGIANRLVDRLRAKEPARDVVVHIDTPLVADGDSTLLTIALENLLGNAWKFTSKRPRARIEVGSRTEHGRIVYYVRDDGAGFDMAYAAKLFRAFQRLHSPSDFDGTGIGLAIVQRIILRHGGRVWAEGAPGAGATFFFTLERHTP